MRNLLLFHEAQRPSPSIFERMVVSCFVKVVGILGGFTSSNKRSAMPRHREINNHLARKICRDLGIPEPTTF